MKTKLIALIIVLAAVVFARKGLDDVWTLERTEWPDRHGELGVSILKLTGVRFDVVAAPDLGILKLALVRAERPILGKVGEPMWFVQMPYLSWVPVR